MRIIFPFNYLSSTLCSVLRAMDYSATQRAECARPVTGWRRLRLHLAIRAWLRQCAHVGNAVSTSKTVGHQTSSRKAQMARRRLRRVMPQPPPSVSEDPEVHSPFPVPVSRPFLLARAHPQATQQGCAALVGESAAREAAARGAWAGPPSLPHTV